MRAAFRRNLFVACLLPLTLGFESAAQDAVLLFDGSLSGWTIEHPGKAGAVASEGVLRIAEDAGWVRTQRTEFKSFVLKFDARSTRPDTRAMFAFFALAPKGRVEGSAYALSLFGNPIPDRKTFKEMALMVLALDGAAVSAALHPVGEWQTYQIYRGRSSLVVSLNGNILISHEVPRSLDGWIGFRTQKGGTELRNIQLRPPPPESTPDIDRFGPGVTVPRVLHEQKPRYTAEAMRARIEGSVLVECVVGIDGTVTQALVARSLDQEFGLDEEAIQAARQWHFEPGMRMGKPVPVVIVIELTFKLRK